MDFDNSNAPPTDESPRAWATWAREASDAADWTVALARWDACVARFGAKKEWEAKRGTALLELQRLSDAERVFKTLAEEQPDDAAGFLGLARVATQRQDWNAALSYLRSARAIDPDSGTGVLANVLLRLGRAEEAKKIWSGLLKHDPDNRKFQVMRLRAAIEVARHKGMDEKKRAKLLRQIEGIAAIADDEAGAVQTIGLFEMIGERRRARNQLLAAIGNVSSLERIDTCFKAIPRLVGPILQTNLREGLLERLRETANDGEGRSPPALGLELRLLLALARYDEFCTRYDSVRGVLAKTPDLVLLERARERLDKPRHEVFAEPKVFGIGLTKTGTTSLSHALGILGIDSAHWSNPLTNQPISEMDIYLFGASSDTCISSRFEQLYYLYPNARFVWTARDAASWQQSFQAHHARHDWTANLDELRTLYDGEDCPFGFASAVIQFNLYLNFRDLREAFVTYEKRVRNFFSDKPAGKLLELDLFAGQGWAELCKFLDRPMPAQAFPWINRAPAELAAASQE